MIFFITFHVYLFQAEYDPCEYFSVVLTGEETTNLFQGELRTSRALDAEQTQSFIVKLQATVCVYLMCISVPWTYFYLFHVVQFSNGRCSFVLGWKSKHFIHGEHLNHGLP